MKELNSALDENARLKKLLAECDLKIEIIKEIQEKSGKAACQASHGVLCL